MATRKKSSKLSKKPPKARKKTKPPARAKRRVRKPAAKAKPRRRIIPFTPPPPKPPVTIDPRLNEGVTLFNARSFYTCHDILEPLWIEAAGRDKDFYRGLIQAAVAFHHWSKGNPGGAMSLYRSSSAYLRKYRPEHLGVDVEQFLSQYMELFGWLRRHRLRYDVRLVPLIRWSRPIEILAAKPS